MNGSYSLLDATGDYPELAHTILNTSVNIACEQTIRDKQDLGNLVTSSSTYEHYYPTKITAY